MNIGTARRKRVWTWAAVGYIVALHLLLVVTVAKTDFIPRLKVKIGMAVEPNRYVQKMVRYHQWMDEHVPERSVVFLGDSITQGLATAAVVPYGINYGIGSENTAQLLDAIPSYKSLSRASTIVLAIGINDLIQGMKDGLDERYRRIDAALPDGTTLLWSSIMPAQYGQVESSDIIEANRVIKTLCQKRAGCVFVDTWSLLADANGRMVQRYFLDDGLHLSPDGYRRWISGLRQAIQLANTRPKATAERNAWQAARHSAER